MDSFTKYGITSRNVVFSHKPFAFFSLTFEKTFAFSHKTIELPQVLWVNAKFLWKMHKFCERIQNCSRDRHHFVRKGFCYVTFPPSPCLFSGSIRGWVNDDRIYIFEWTIPFIWLAQSEEHRSAPVCTDHPQKSLSHFSHICPDKVMMFWVTPLTVHLDSWLPQGWFSEWSVGENGRLKTATEILAGLGSEAARLWHTGSYRGGFSFVLFPYLYCVSPVQFMEHVWKGLRCEFVWNKPLAMWQCQRLSCRNCWLVSPLPKLLFWEKSLFVCDI